MNFLYRLHPASALQPGAVRADIAPRFAAPAALPEADWPVPAPARGAGAAAPAVHGAPPPLAAAAARPLAPVAVPAAWAPSPAVAAQAAASVAAVPRRQPEAAPAATQPAPLAKAVERVIERHIDPVIEHPSTAVPAAVFAARAATSPAAGQMPLPTPARVAAAPVQRSTATRPPLPPAPLRAQAVPRAPATPAPTVVQVSIDRLDVRLPAEPSAAPSPAARRQRGGGPTLGDYLRGKGGGAR